ncbi:MAG: hypothetical protein RIT04_681 [Candidatus Parcubacteria bacterium]
MKEICTTEIKGEIGIELNEKDLEGVDLFLQAVAIENPNKLFQIKDQIALNKELPEQIALVQGQLQNFERDMRFAETMARFEKDEKNVELASKGVGVGAKLKMFGSILLDSAMLQHGKGEGAKILDARGELKEKGVDVSREGLDEYLNKTRGLAATYQEQYYKLQGNKVAALEDIQNQLKANKQAIFAHMGLRMAIMEVSNQKLKEQISGISKKGGLSGYTQAAGSLAEKSSGENTGLEYFDDTSEEAFRKEIDEQAEQHIEGVISKNLKEIKFGAGTFSRLEKSITEVIDATGAGSKNQAETRAFVIETIGRVAEGLPDTAEGRARKILAKQLAAKLQK